MGQLTLQPDAAAGKDAYLNEPTPDTNYGGGSVQMKGIVNSKRHSILEFDISSIPAGATIDSATLFLSEQGGAQLTTGELVRMTQAGWVELEATWNQYANGSNWTTSGGDADTTQRTTFTTIGNGEGSVDALDAQPHCQDALDNRSGLVRLLIRPTETGWSVGWHSSDSTTASKRPKLVVNYTPSGGGGAAGGDVAFIA